MIRQTQHNSRTKETETVFNGHRVQKCAAFEARCAFRDIADHPSIGIEGELVCSDLRFIVARPFPIHIRDWPLLALRHTRPDPLLSVSGLQNASAPLHYSPRSQR